MLHREHTKSAVERKEQRKTQPSGQMIGKLKVAVYGEGAPAASGNGLKRGKMERARFCFSSRRVHTSSRHILLIEALAASSPRKAPPPSFMNYRVSTRCVATRGHQQVETWKNYKTAQKWKSSEISMEQI